MPTINQRFARPLTALSVAGLSALILACGSTASTPGKVGTTAPAASNAATGAATTSEATDAPMPTATTEPTPTPEPAEAGSSRSNPLPLGAELRFETWSVTISNVIRGEQAQQAIAGANQFNEPPPEGHEYLLADVRLENISSEQKSQSVLFGTSIGVTGQNNKLYSEASIVTPKELEGEVFPGGVTEGQVVFAVPAGEKNLLFQISEAFAITQAPRFVAIDEGAALTPDAALGDITATDIGTRRDAPAPLGETATSDTWEVTVLEVVRGEQAAALVQQANQFNEPAPSGSEFVAVKLRVRAIGVDTPDEAQNVDGSLLNVSGEKNVVYEHPSVVAPDPMLDARLFPGGVAEGWEVFSVASGEQKLVLIFEPLFSFSDTNTRFLTLE